MKNDKKAEKKHIFQNKFINKQDFEGIFKIILKVISFGFMLDLGLLVFHVPFGIVEIISLGALYWLVDEHIVGIIRRLIHKR